jgi:N-methylhydantoinase B
MVRFDPVKLEIFKNLFRAVAEEMGAALRRTAFSPNIKERRDYSCAVFSSSGEVIAMGDHMPVHLGSMPLSVAAAIQAFPLEPGDIALLNDPFAGGTHLPDITLVMPVFLARPAIRDPLGRGFRVTLRNSKGAPRPVKSRPAGRSPSRGVGRSPLFYVASRAHHADVGGAQPGSMGLARDIYQEGLRLPPVKIAEGGVFRREVFELILANVRTPWEREGDLTAQVAACRLGARRLEEMIERYTRPEVQAYVGHLLDYSARTMQATLQAMPSGTYVAEDFLDDDGFSEEPIPIRVGITMDGGRARVDFSGSAPQTAGAVNAVRAITLSAVFYVFRCLVPEETPATAGLLRPIEVITRPGSVVDARAPAAVAAGNVETSQRIVDTLLKALAQAISERIPAASQGTMNNFTVGGRGRDGELFAYYETIAGGMGARPGAKGLDGVHTHMTNSLNTPIEALESFYPLRVRSYRLRQGSGGQGQAPGGEGVLREIELLTDATVAILSDRRRTAPYGLAGGRPGKPGRNRLRRGRRVIKLPGKCTVSARAGDIVSIATPGGGGWGRVRKKRN